MKSVASVLALLVLAAFPAAHAVEVSPIGKVIEMISGLQAKVTTEGEEAEKSYTEFSEWCEDRAKTLEYEIKTGKAAVAELKASIAEQTALGGSLTTKVEELSASIASDEADLKAATEIRAKEAADFMAEEKELTEVIDMLERAVGILQKEMAKGGASMLQLKNAGSLAQALGVLVQASVFSSADKERLTALVQSSQQSEDSDSDASLGAPAGAVYESHSGGIIGTLEDLMEKAEGQLDDARKKETSALQNFEMLKQSIKDEVKFGTKDMTEAKTGLAASAEKKSVATGDLGVTSKELGVDMTSLSELHTECMTKAQDFEAETKSREEELKALAEAKKVVIEATGGAAASFLQVTRSTLSSGADLAKFEAVRFVRDLARKQHAPVLAQLALRMASAMRAAASGGADPFAKVKGLIGSMILKLEEEAGEEASQKAFCDKELAETNTNKEDKTGAIEKLSTKIDQMSSRSSELKEQTSALQKGLSELASSQAEMDKMRMKENDAYKKDKEDTEVGLEGIKTALSVLREYYGKSDKAHSAAEGAGAGIIGLLEVCESDFSKGLAELVATEESAAVSYEQETKENALEKAAKDQDVKYKTKEAADLDKAVAEASSDRSGIQTELNAVMQYLFTLKSKCVAKPETYAEKKARYEAEIAGLKEALTILDGEAMLIQQGSRRTLRGGRQHRPAA